MKLLINRNDLLNLNFWDKLFLLIAVVLFLNPIIIFFLYNLGFSIIYHQINVYIILLLITLSILYILSSYKISFYHTILSTVLVIFLLTVIGSFYTVFEKESFIKLVGLYFTIAGAPLISVFFLKYYKRNGNVNIFINFIFFGGIIIAFVNTYYFFLLYFGDYTSVYKYTEFIGLGAYLKDLGTFFIRPAGFFFDYHSQYYLPMFCVIFLVDKTIEIKKYFKKVFLFLCIVSILISGIKSAYLTGVVLLLFYFLKQLSFFKILLASFIVFLITMSIDYYYNSIIYDLVYKIFTHDINILFRHLFEVPQVLLTNYFHVFLFGGQVGMEAYIYSEVYLITLIYYIGFVGLIVLFIYPIIYTFVNGKTFLVQSVTIIFAMSLIHYYVFKSSFNIIGTSLFYFFFFSILYKNKLINE